MHHDATSHPPTTQWGRKKEKKKTTTTERRTLYEMLLLSDVSCPLLRCVCALVYLWDTFAIIVTWACSSSKAQTDRERERDQDRARATCRWQFIKSITFGFDILNKHIFTRQQPRKRERGEMQNETDLTQPKLTQRCDHPPFDGQFDSLYSVNDRKRVYLVCVNVCYV